MCYIATESPGVTLGSVAKTPRNPRSKGPARPTPREPTVETARTLGERIRALYLAKGLNRSQLQRALGVAYTTILAWEEDRYVPDRDNLRALSVVVGVPESVILGEDEPMTEVEYDAWRAFLETAIGQDMKRHERVALGSMRFDPDDPPSVERYTAILFAIRGTRIRGSA